MNETNSRLILDESVIESLNYGMEYSNLSYKISNETICPKRINLVFSVDNSTGKFDNEIAVGFKVPKF